MIAYTSNCFMSPGWLASVAEGDSIINATLLLFLHHFLCLSIYNQSKRSISALLLYHFLYLAIYNQLKHSISALLLYHFLYLAIYKISQSIPSVHYFCIIFSIWPYIKSVKAFHQCITSVSFSLSAHI